MRVSVSVNSVSVGVGVSASASGLKGAEDKTSKSWRGEREMK